MHLDSFPFCNQECADSVYFSYNEPSVLPSNIIWYLHLFVYVFVCLLFRRSAITSETIFDSDSLFVLLVSSPTFELEDTFVVVFFLFVSLRCFNFLH